MGLFFPSVSCSDLRSPSRAKVSSRRGRSPLDQILGYPRVPCRGAASVAVRPCLSFAAMSTPRSINRLAAAVVRAKCSGVASFRAGRRGRDGRSPGVPERHRRA